MAGFIPATALIALAIFAVGWLLGRRRGMAEDRLAALIRSEGREQGDRVIVAVLRAQAGREEEARRATLYPPECEGDGDRESPPGS